MSRVRIRVRGSSIYIYIYQFFLKGNVFERARAMHVFATEMQVFSVKPVRIWGLYRAWMRTGLLLLIILITHDYYVYHYVSCRFSAGIFVGNCRSKSVPQGPQFYQNVFIVVCRYAPNGCPDHLKPILTMNNWRVVKGPI